MWPYRKVRRNSAFPADQKRSPKGPFLPDITPSISPLREAPRPLAIVGPHLYNQIASMLLTGSRLKLPRAHGGCLGTWGPMKDVADCEKLRGAASRL